MEGVAPVSPASSGSFSASSSTNEAEIDPGSWGEEGPMDMIAEGTPVVVRIEQKALLDFVMRSLDSLNDPLFTEIDCAEEGYKYSIKLDVSGLRSLSGQSQPETVVVGEPAFNRYTAKCTAAWKALNYLHEQHRVKVLDFSSRVANRLDSYKSYDLIIDGMRALDHLFTQWKMASLFCENSAVSLEGMKFDELVLGELNDKGHVFELAAESIGQLLISFHEKTDEARSAMSKVQDDLRQYQKYMAIKEQKKISKVYYHTVQLSSKDVLAYVLAYFQLDEPEYNHTPGLDSYVHSTVKFIFPYMENYQFGGPITIPGKGIDYVEAKENAAFQALSFIEKNFPVKVVDCNYSKRKKASKHQNDLVVMCSTILEIAEQVKKLWSQLNTETAGIIDLISLDPRELFSSGMVDGQIDAYKNCAARFNEMRQYSAQAYASCASDFDMMLKLKWKLFELKLKMQK